MKLFSLLFFLSFTPILNIQNQQLMAQNKITQLQELDQKIQSLEAIYFQHQALIDQFFKAELLQQLKKLSRFVENQQALLLQEEQQLIASTDAAFVAVGMMDDDIPKSKFGSSMKSWIGQLYNAFVDIEDIDPVKVKAFKTELQKAFSPDPVNQYILGKLNAAIDSLTNEVETRKVIATTLANILKPMWDDAYWEDLFNKKIEGNDEKWKSHYRKDKTMDDHFPKVEDIVGKLNKIEIEDTKHKDHPAIIELDQWLKKLLSAFKAERDLADQSAKWENILAGNLKIRLDGEFAKQIVPLGTALTKGLTEGSIPKVIIYDILILNTLEIQQQHNKISLLGNDPRNIKWLPADSLILEDIEKAKDPNVENDGFDGGNFIKEFKEAMALDSSIVSKTLLNNTLYLIDNNKFSKSLPKISKSYNDSDAYVVNKIIALMEAKTAGEVVYFQDKKNAFLRAIVEVYKDIDLIKNQYQQLNQALPSSYNLSIIADSIMQHTKELSADTFTNKYKTWSLEASEWLKEVQPKYPLKTQQLIEYIKSNFLLKTRGEKISEQIYATQFDALLQALPQPTCKIEDLQAQWKIIFENDQKVLASLSLIFQAYIGQKKPIDQILAIHDTYVNNLPKRGQIIAAINLSQDIPVKVKKKQPLFKSPQQLLGTNYKIEWRNRLPLIIIGLENVAKERLDPFGKIKGSIVKKLTKWVKDLFEDEETFLQLSEDGKRYLLGVTVKPDLVGIKMPLEIKYMNVDGEQIPYAVPSDFIPITNKQSVYHLDFNGGHLIGSPIPENNKIVSRCLLTYKASTVEHNLSVGVKIIGAEMTHAAPAFTLEFNLYVESVYDKEKNCLTVKIAEPGPTDLPIKGRYEEIVKVTLEDLSDAQQVIIINAK